MNIVLCKSATCPKCKIVAAKLDQAGIEYEVIEDTEKIIEMGVKSIPTLIVDGEKYVDVVACNNWIKAQGGAK